MSIGLGATIGNARRPAYHEGMLILKLRGSAQTSVALAREGELERLALDHPGLYNLSVLERVGMIRRVIPLARPREGNVPVHGTRPLAMLSVGIASATSSGERRGGVSILELERDADVPELQLALGRDPSVEWVSRVPARYWLAPRGTGRTGFPGRRRVTPLAVPPPAGALWNLRRISWAEARALPTFSEAGEVRVAVLDTGVDPDHPELQGRIATYVYEHPDLPFPISAQDIVGHGTHVTGTIGARIGNEIGINGICECRIHVWKIFTDSPTATGSAFEYLVDPVIYRRALADCADGGMDVLNLSIGGPAAPDPQEQALFDELLGGGTTVVAAMGNERQQGSPTSYPAAVPGVIAVGATSIDDSVAGFSSAGRHITLCAPGVGIWSTLPTYPGQLGFEAVQEPGGDIREGRPLTRETGYDAWSGTSMASPHVAASAALLLANRGRMDGAEVRERLMRTADRVPGMGGAEFNADYGAGRLNLLRLLGE